MIKSFRCERTENNQDRKVKSVGLSLINVGCPICMHLKLVGNGNDDISSEEHFENSKTRRGIYLLQELFIFVQIFEIYLVAQSL
jgi:hypothetical protein